MRNFCNKNAISALAATFLIAGIPHLLFSQNVGIGTASPLEKLHVIGNIRTSTLAGIGSRMVLADPNGTLTIGGAGLGPAWLTTGNTGTLAGTNFIGTIDSVDFVIKTRSIERMRTFGGGAISVNNATTQAGDVFGVYGTGYAGTINITNNFAINGYVNTNAGAAIYGENASGISIYGNSGGTGVLGTTTNASGFGLQAVNSNANGTGVIGTGNNLGGIFLTAGSGASFRGTRFGTLSFANVPSASSGSAVLGINNKTNIVSFIGGAGVTGIDSLAGSGVIGASYAAGGDGVYGTGLGSNGTGVTGVANAGTAPYGVWGIVPTATTGGTSIAIIGDNQTTNANAVGVLGIEAAGANAATRWAVFGNGDIGASGVKTFTIDHPTDPENKFLRHFSIESNEVLNVYRGNVTLNASGEATVALPSYFASVNNSNITYNLTPIGQAASLFVKSEVSNGTFVIGGGAPGQKVSWTVTSERNDPYLQQNPESRNAEVAKSQGAQGKYLMPELYGKGPELRMFNKNSPIRLSTPVETLTPVLQAPR